MKNQIAATLFLVLSVLQPTYAQNESASFLESLSTKATSLQDESNSELVKQFLSSVSQLDSVEPRPIFYCKRNRMAFTEKRFTELKEANQVDPSEFEERVADDKLYYGYYSTPLAWARPLEIISDHGFESANGKRILDFGFGNIAQLKLLAMMGASVTGVEVADGFHEAMYASESDQETLDRLPASGIENDGSVKLAFGKWPAEEKVVTAVGNGYDLIISKNVLKLGYIHPQQDVSERMLIDLGVDDEAFLNATMQSLNPGGLVLVYNIHPTQSPLPANYKPWAHGETPWEKDQVEKAGFEILKWHVDDSQAIQELGVALGWDESFKTATEFQAGFRAMYTILRKPD